MQSVQPAFDGCFLPRNAAGRADIGIVQHRRVRLLRAQHGERAAVAAAGVGDDRDDGLATEIVFIQQAVDRHRHRVPPDRVDHEHRVVAQPVNTRSKGGRRKWPGAWRIYEILLFYGDLGIIKEEGGA